MKRLAETYLLQWLRKKRRKPLVLRGARQVGKSTLVRQFCQHNVLRLVEINLEKFQLDALFQTNDATTVVRELEILTGQKIDPADTLLFLDEIQAAPSALACLRYFYEEWPRLAVIGAGSLLELLLGHQHFSMPVGRIEYFHLGPMTFSEFLWAKGDDGLVALLQDVSQQSLFQHFSAIGHDKLTQCFKEYLMVGGMPEAVLSYCEGDGLLDVKAVHRSITDTYQDDFSKYAKHHVKLRIDKVLNYIPGHVGEKVKYTNISTQDQARELKQAIDYLIQARIVLPVYHSSCSGMPINSGVNDKIYKLYFLDVGLVSHLLGLHWHEIRDLNAISLINKGQLAEQFIAQHLFYRYQGVETPQLHYWLRDGKTTNAEIDFVVNRGLQLVPIEVKAGKTGRLKSLHQFVWEKNSQRAIRFDLNPPCVCQIDTRMKNQRAQSQLQYALLSLPLYWVEKMDDCLSISNGSVL